MSNFRKVCPLFDAAAGRILVKHHANIDEQLQNKIAERKDSITELRRSLSRPSKQALIDATGEYKEKRWAAETALEKQKEEGAIAADAEAASAAAASAAFILSRRNLISISPSVGFGSRAGPVTASSSAMVGPSASLCCSHLH